MVVFSQRQDGDTWERRVEVERTEVEPERNPQVWPGWDCEPVCGWMTGQLGLAEGTGPTSQPGSEKGPADAATEPAMETGGAVAPPPEAAAHTADRPRLRIESAAIIDATGSTDTVTAGSLAANPPTELVAPVRVVFTVSGARPGTRLLAVTRILRRDGPGWNPEDPVVVPDSGRAEFDLSGVPAGEHEMSLIAWAPDVTAVPVSMRLPKMTIRSGSTRQVGA